MQVELGADVDATGGVVEQQDSRGGVEPFGEHELLLVAAGEERGGLVDGGGADAEPGDQQAGAGTEAGAGQQGAVGGQRH